MKMNRLTVLALLLLIAVTTFAQKNKFALFLKDGVVIPKANINSIAIDSCSRQSARFNNKAFVMLQFDELPSEESKKLLAAAGIQLLNYVPNNAYTATISGSPDIRLLQKLKARAFFTLSPRQKMHPLLSRGIIPAWAQKVSGTADVWISFPKTFSSEDVIASLKEKNVDVISTQYEQYNILVVRVAVNRLTEIAASSFVAYMQPAPPQDEPLIYNSRRGSRANVLNASVANGGKGLNGEGVVMGIGDIGYVQDHVDFSGRIINSYTTLHEPHAMWVHGAAAGAGIVNEMYRGYASKAKLITHATSGIITNAPTYIKDYNMVLTNNSYGAGFNCDYNGTYDLTSQVLDQQIVDFPSLEHVFAAGNSARNSCLPYAPGFKTVLGGFQSAKNILCVGNSDDEGNLFNSSSKGPVKDGRLKPDLVADGTAVTSTWANNSYHTDWGTSISAPAVTGGLALLYQRYRQLHNNADPKSALMKAVICNGATDKGNAGPDYSYGYGYLNLLRSLDMVDNNHYFIGNSTNGSTDVQTITVPANTAQLKVMLYWHDPTASLLSSRTLVNDLDLEVVDPTSNTLLPKKVDTTVTNVTAAATTGADHINNMEQVVIDNPANGNYTLHIKGTAIAQNPTQEYVVVYDIIPVSLQLTYPVGGEGLVPGENTKISWESYGDPHTFTLQYSTDNGTTWATINDNIDANSRFFTWQLPATITDKAIVRIIKNGTALSSVSNVFTIIGIPTVTLSPVQCEGYIAINWNAVPNATDYEVMMLRGDEMVSVTTTSSTSYTINSLSKDSTYWVSVRARINGKGGRRAIAISRQPNNGNCSGSISDNDLKLEAVISPISGRKYTSTELSASTPVKIQIKNLDDAPASGFTVKYSINGSALVSEDIAATIAAGDIYTHTFGTTANLAAIGNYTLVAVVKNNSADKATANDTLVTIVKQLDNPPINFATPFLDNIESASAATYTNDTIGLQGMDRYDFENTSPYGRLRTFVNTGIAYSGSKSLTLDNTIPNSNATNNYLTGTFNLSGYHAAANDVRLDFRYAFRSQAKSDTNSIWIRGKDTQPWIKVYNFSNQTGTATPLYKLSPSIEITDSLTKYGQDFSSSFQIRWGQYAFSPGSDKDRLYSIDDIHLYEAFNDMQVLSIDTPVNLSCGLSATVPLKITVKNSNNAALSNIPVRYAVNGGNWITESIPSIAGNTTLQYTFIHTVDLSATGAYTIRAIVDYPSDNYRLNDTVETTLHNAPLISSFPYLQNFEVNNGGWYADGTNSSWEYGTPASGKINHAASGAKAWKTRLAGNYNDEEHSYLYSPCFDIGSMKKPTLSFSVALDLEDCGNVTCDAAWVEYSADGKTWQKLIDTANTGTNWYNAGNKTIWSIENYTRWHVATVSLPVNISRIRLRFVLSSDQAVNKEGVALDDIHIYDNSKGIYDGATLPYAVSKSINAGTDWVDFESNGKLIASVQPNNQNMGVSNVQAYINTSGIRNTNHQYYHNRNITIKPVTRLLADSVAVRFYFLDTEAEALIKATGCADCSPVSNAYELGISKYSDRDTSHENGTVDDNKKGFWSFIPSDNVAKVPFDKGYYAEFKVKGFSEFWLSKSSLSDIVPIPVYLIDFTAQKLPNYSVVLNWVIANDINADHYEIEVARSNEDLQANRFEKIGAVTGKHATAQQPYSFTDPELVHTGVRYYRLKIVDINGGFIYSSVRSIVITTNNQWMIYPNPSAGIFYLVYQLNAGEAITLKITDRIGRTMQELKLIGDGFMQKQTIDLSGKRYAAGVYLLQTNKRQSFKLYKQ